MYTKVEAGRRACDVWKDAVTVLGLVGGAPARASRVFQNSVPPFKQNRFGNPLEKCTTFARSIMQATLDRVDC